MTELDLEALARDYEWTSMRFDGGDATERATGRLVRIERTRDSAFLSPFERAAIARRVAELADPRVLPVLRTEPWIVARAPETSLPLAACFDAALELLDAAQRVEAGGLGVARLQAERVDDGFRVWVEPSSRARPPEPEALGRVFGWLLGALDRVVGTKKLRSKLRQPSSVSAAARAWAQHASPSGVARAATIEDVPYGPGPLPDLDAAERVGEALWAASPGDPDVGVELAAIHHHFGCVAWAEGALDEAERRLERALELYPSARNLTTRALLARRQGDEGLEAELLDREPAPSLSMRVDDAARHLCARASSLARRGRVVEAMQLLAYDDWISDHGPSAAWLASFRARYAPEG
ncbi:MAG: hypothetical protein R3B99_19530 [Polyangiales bacterium]